MPLRLILLDLIIPIICGKEHKFAKTFFCLISVYAEIVLI